MTVGKDVSALFTDVTMCMQTDNLELKKLVYLYLINYAKTQPDLAILAVNTFVKVNKRMYYAICSMHAQNNKCYHKCYHGHEFYIIMISLKIVFRIAKTLTLLSEL